MKENDTIQNYVLVLAGAISAVLGLAVMVGWYAHIPAAVQVHPSFGPMQFNSAFSFFLCGLGLLSIVFSRRSMSAACGMIPAAIALATIMEYLSGLDFGIDQFFITHYIVVNTPHAGRMAPNAAISFILSGVAIVLMNSPVQRKRRSKILGLLGSMITSSGMLAFISYFIGIPTAYGWGRFIFMAALTSAGFIVLGTGIVSFAWYERRGALTGVHEWPPVAIGIAIFTGAMLLWHGLISFGQGVIEEQIEFHKASNAMLIVELLMALLLAFAVFFAQRAVLHMRRTLAANKKLKQEIAERKRIQKNLLVKHKAIEASINGVSISDLDGRLTYINRSSLTMWGFTEEGEILGRHVSEFMERPEEAAGIIEHVFKNGTYIDEVKGRRKDGSLFDVQYCASLVKDEKEMPLCIMISCLDITEKRMMEDAIKYQAYHDFLTELPNRLLFMDRLNLALAQAQRTRSISAVLFIDLDRFKNINDSLGHNAGDLLLKDVAVRLKSCIRDSDTVARIGGDEYAILLHDITQAEDASRIAQKILEDVRRPCLVDGHEFQITASIGISFYPADGGQSDALLKSADIAMYYAKERGRNNSSFIILT